MGIASNTGILSMLKEESGLWSMRRVLSLLFAVYSNILFIMAMPYVASGWVVFIPGLAYMCASLVLLLFTTWEEITKLAAALRKQG